MGEWMRFSNLGSRFFSFVREQPRSRLEIKNVNTKPRHRKPEDMINVAGRWRTPEEIEEEEARSAIALAGALGPGVDWEDEERKDQYRRNTYDLLPSSEQALLNEAAGDEDELDDRFSQHFEACIRDGLPERECARRWMTRMS